MRSRLASSGDALLQSAVHYLSEYDSDVTRLQWEPTPPMQDLLDAYELGNDWLGVCPEMLVAIPYVAFFSRRDYQILGWLQLSGQFLTENHLESLLLEAEHSLARALRWYSRTLRSTR